MPEQEPVPIAIIGMGCRYAAGANSPEALWSVVAEGRDGWTKVPLDRFDEASFYHPDPDAPGGINQKGGHFIDQPIAAFDAGFFGIPPMEAEALDPQQRVMLETSWEAVENAGIPMHRFKGSDTGVFVAMFGHDYEQIMHKDPLVFTRYHNTGIARPLLANRVSYVFDLEGPSIMFDTACSGSLVAVNSACQSLRARETEMALAGGVGLIFSPDQMALMSLTQLFNGEGKSYTFDDRGNGYGRAEGVGMVMLKRLDDAVRDGDNIRAVIRSSGVNSDGRTNGITLPNQLAQERLARSLFRDLPFTPADIQYAEAHGTGTKAGDVTETLAVRNVFCQGRDTDQPLFVGTAKPNIGHSEAASGAAGLIKTVLAMEKGLIAPNILLETFKPGLEPDQWNMKIVRSLTPWPATQTTRKAVVNSFGFGGTNAMVVLESGSAQDDGHRSTGINGYTNGVGDHDSTTIKTLDNINHEAPSHCLFTLSARSEHSLIHAVKDLKNYLERHDDINMDDLSYTLTTRRSNFQWRSSVVAHDIKSLVNSLGADNLARVKVPSHISNVFVFTGQGAQWARMGYELISGENEFSRSIHRSDMLLRTFGAQWGLAEELSRDESTSQINDSQYGQPASTAVQIALVDLLKSWNVQPTAVIGHSSGEIAAAYAAGAITQSAAIRISYHRSFLAKASRLLSAEQGSMMAVGLGQEGVERYIMRLTTTSTVAVACINSPSSTTVSGDATAVWNLKKVLDEDGIFARLLKVDTAYHSHHMRLVSDDYLVKLEGLESGTVDPAIRFFSTVTGEEKHDDFGSSYWVENLVSPVRFSTALQLLCQDQTSLNLIEIGPHKALASPIRQTLAELQDGGLSYNYIPTLVHGENTYESLAATGSKLFMSGSDFDVGAMASLGIKSLPKLLRDLPPYHWDHTVTHWAESRLSRDYRCRRHPHHDLLGSRNLTSPDSQPSWRNILRTDSLPWLRDHVVDNFVVFPAAGYMTMAIEAMRQLDQDRRPDLVPKGYRLKNVSFKKTLTLPRDAQGVETILTFRSPESDETYEFNVFSMSEQGKWQEHCQGSISTTFEKEVDQTWKVEIDDYFPVNRLKSAQVACTKIVKKESMYADMAATGNVYGPSFAVNEEVRLANYQSLNSIAIPNIAAIMPAQFMQPHVIHPTTLDGVIQTCVPLFQQHSARGSVMPLFLGEIFISADISNVPGEKLKVVCDLSDTFPHSTNFNTAVFQTDKRGEPRCVLTMDKGEIRVVGESKVLPDKHNDNIFKMQWGIDASSITAEMLESVVIPLQSDEAGMSQAEKVNATFLASASYIDWTVKEVRESGLPIADDHQANLWRWLTKYADSDAGRALIQRSPKSREEVEQLTGKLGVEGESIARIGPQLTDIITGKTDPLALFLKDELLFRVYHGDECARPNRYMAEYVKLLTFQKRNLRILEIGAGTGGTTFQILQACSPNGEEFCSEYMYTDISSGFFESVRTTRLKQWEHLLTFRTLDLERDPAEQGFEEHSYDLVIAANVVHATRSLAKSLNSIYRLLKPGGQLGLVELTKTTPFINMTFGSIAGWWAGVDEGRTESPLQSVEQWNQHLIKASFSGVDLAAHDLPEPERHSALLLSTALQSSVTSNGYHTSPIKMLNAIPEDSGNSFCENLVEDLVKKGFEPSLIEWTNDAVDESCSYVVIDSTDNLLLQNASPVQFSHLTSLLSKACNVYWVTLANNTTGNIAPDNALAVGLSRSARNENPKLNCFTIDVQDSITENLDRIRGAVSAFIESTERKIAKNEPLEFELMYRNGQMHIQRFVPDSKLLKATSGSTQESETEDTIFNQSKRPLKVHVEKPGLLSSLVFVDDKVGEVGSDEVEIESYAWGVNFKDVFVALGQMKPNQTMVGESAGVIRAVGSNFTSQYKVGDRVSVMFGTPYANRTRANGHLIHLIPDEMSFVDAASISLTFGTAYYSLFDCANLEQGQSILIHAASGALGQAAIKIAQRVGATIYATVGSDAKRTLLKHKYGIPENHIFSSRTTDFAAGIKRLTGGAGVDVVLNSLSGPVLQASWECVASLGTFVEVGKTDIYRRGQLSMEPFDRNVRFISVDMVVLSQKRPKHVQKLLQRVFSDFEKGHFTVLPIETMPIDDIEKAFRRIQSRNHTGKIVLEANDESTVKAKVQPLQLHGDGTYIIVGGLGGLGKHLCRHLQTRGARHVALFSRRAFGGPTREIMERELIEVPGSVVRIITCDISNANSVMKVAVDLGNVMPPVKGLIHGAMILSDRTVSQITQDDFRKTLESKYHGTKNLYDAFRQENLDFFIMLSSLCGVIGTLGQSNYAAGGTYQDMFTHAQVSRGNTKFVTLDVPLIENTYPVAPTRIESLGRQGCQLVPIDVALPIIDYAMSGRAFKDGVHQIAFGLDPQSFISQAQHGGRVAPLFSHIMTQGRSKPGHSDQTTKRTAEELISQASTTEDAEKLMLVAIREKISSLTALDSQELDLDTPVANMALDSLIATEIKNWITNMLQALVQVSDITDAPSLRSLAAFVTQNSSLVKANSKANGTKHETNGEIEENKQVALPSYPLQPIDAAMELFLESVSHLGNEEDMQRTRDAVTTFLRDDGIGRRLQARLEKLNNDDNTDDDVIDIYVRNKWLRGRDWRPRLRNFFATLPLPNKLPIDQAGQAALISLTAYEYKLALDMGTVQPDLLNEQLLCMETVYWLFNTNRTPVLECDRADRWPGNDYIVVMRHGHAYKVPLCDADGQTISHGKLKAIFKAIIQQAPHEVNWASIFPTANRDEWAKIREEITASSPANDNFISTIEKSMFIICLDDTSPTTAKERAACFLLDDNSNRWLDKTVSFVVCANGVSSMFCEHTMVDGTTFGGLIDAIKGRAAEPVEEPEESLANSLTVSADEFTCLPFTMPPALDELVPRLRAEHLDAHSGYGLCNYNHTAYGASYLRGHRLPPKTVCQLIVQMAVRRLLGYNLSGAVDVISQRPFKGGRTDMIYVGTNEVAAFCAVAEDPVTKPADRRRLFLEAVKSHARLVTLSTRGKGWRWHLLALREMLEPGEDLPEFYEDVVYKRTSERPVCTSFTEFGLPETGRCQPKREDLWIGVQVFEKSVTFTVINGQGRADELADHIKGASEVMREIIETNAT